MSSIDNCHFSSSWSGKKYIPSKTTPQTKNEKTLTSVVFSTITLIWPTVIISIITGPIGIVLAVTTSLSIITAIGYTTYIWSEDD